MKYSYLYNLNMYGSDVWKLSSSLNGCRKVVGEGREGGTVWQDGVAWRGVGWSVRSHLSSVGPADQVSNGG